MQEKLHKYYNTQKRHYYRTQNTGDKIRDTNIAEGKKIIFIES